jgi:DNA (cytosine-5)-methyltransferase 1
MKFIDLFAGIGGFRIALENSKNTCVFSSEWDKYAQLTYKYNFKETPYGDITQINEHDIPDHDILCGGFPCQAFSVSGKQAGFTDIRGTLFFDIARIVKLKQPKVLFLENVKNLFRHDNGNTLKTVISVLEDINYNTFIKVLDSSHFGVPQHRERIFMVSFHKDLKINDFEFPKPTFEQIILEDILEKDVNLSRFKINRKDIHLDLDKIKIPYDLFSTKQLKPIRIGTISKGGQGERIYSSKGHAITLSAYGGGVAGKTGAYFIDGIIRQLTPRECLRVQGFPEAFNFPEEISVSQNYKMCGNSVSVPVVKKIYESISDRLI